MAETLLQKAQRLGIQPAGEPRADVVSRVRGRAETAQTEFERVASPLGQFKETVKGVGEIFGIQPTARKIAAGIAPFVVPEEELPEVVEELVGGVVTPQPSKFKEFAQIAVDLPLISLGLSKSLASFLGKQGAKIAPEPLKRFISKELSQFLPSVFRKDISTPVTKAVVELGERAIDIAKKPFSFVVSRVPKLFGIVTGESTDVVIAALKDPIGADRAIANGDEALRNVVRESAEKATQLRDGFNAGHRESLAKFSESLPEGLTFDRNKVISQFEELLKQNKVKIVDGKLDFSVTTIQANAGDVTNVKKAWAAINNWDDFSFSGINELKRLLQKLARFSDAAGTPAKSPTIGVAQRQLNDFIKETLSKEQKEVLEEINKNYADNIELFDDMVDVFNRGDPFTKLANIFGENKDSLRQVIGFFEEKSGANILSTVAGRELSLERKAAFGFLNPRTWIDLIFPPRLQAKLVTKTGKTFPKIVK